MFGKKKITSEELAENLAEIVVDSISADTLSIYQMFLKDLGESTEISEGQKKEILTINLLATSRSIQNAFKDDPQYAKRLTDSVFEAVYKKLQLTEEEAGAFEETIRMRFVIYYKILHDGGEFAHFSFGKEFTDRFLNRDATDAIALITTASDFFVANVKSTEEFINELSQTYKLEKFND